MPFIRVIKEALASILANKTRSFLTVLGIVIGVGAVIGMLSIGAGAQSSILGQIESIGTNVVYIMPGTPERNDPGTRKPLTISDSEALANRNRAPHILRIAPVLMDQVNVSLTDSTLNTQLVGSYPEYAAISAIELAEGNFFSASEMESRAAVIVIGPELAERLTGRRSGVVGTMVRINDVPYRVVGVTKGKGSTQFSNPDLIAYMPITTMQLRVSRQSGDNVHFIIIQAQDAQSIQTAMDEAKMILRQSHRLNTRQEDDFSLTNQEEIVGIANSVTNILTIFLAGIAGISLLVGGIGIMNIMLVTVTERTREIGLRKALGAHKADIMLQFLTESALLSLIGGIIGIGLGWALGMIVGIIASRSGTPLSPVVQPQAVLLSTVTSTLVGLFFGWYPAKRAAELEPVEALRYE